MSEPIDTAAIREHWRCDEPPPCGRATSRHYAYRTIAAICDALEGERAKRDEDRAEFKRATNEQIAFVVRQRERLKAAKDEHAAALDVLRRQEWLDDSFFDEPTCPECRRCKGLGHAAGCELAALLRGGRNVDSPASGGATEPSGGGKGV